jgi:hypothetical protein
MTIQKIETVKKLIEEMGSENVGSVWEYINGMNNQTMFAVFSKNQPCDIFSSPFVKEPKQIWLDGIFLDEYEYLNDEQD